MLKDLSGGAAQVFEVVSDWSGGSRMANGVAGSIFQRGRAVFVPVFLQVNSSLFHVSIVLKGC